MTSLTRREFTYAALASAAATGLPGCRSTTTGDTKLYAQAYEPGGPLPWTNWAGNQSCVPAGRSAPESEAALLESLSAGRGAIRPVGAGHSFSALVPSPGTLVSTDLMTGVVSSDAATLQAEVWSGTRLGQLGPALHSVGQALPNMPDIDYQALGGAIATSTHGTGAGFGSLSAYVEGLSLATPSGELLECDAERNAEVFHAARCSLGALGIVTRLRLQNQAPFMLAESTQAEPLEDVFDDLDRRVAENRCFEFFALPHTTTLITVETNEIEPGEGSAGTPEVEDPEAVYQARDAYRALGGMFGIGGWAYRRAIKSALSGPPTVRSGRSFQVLSHVRTVRFREMEYTMPAEAGPACLREILDTMREKRIPVSFPIEVRWIAADDVWLSPFYQRAGCSISIHQFADEDYEPYFAQIEPIFWKYEGRPHWGKLHTLDAPRLGALHPRLRDFNEVREGLDPAGRLLNPHLREVLGTGTAAPAPRA
jgi:FAD-linked oxidoreductase